MNEMKTKKIPYPFLIVLIGAILMLVMLFLPFASAQDDYKENLERYGDKMWLEEINMTNADAVNISLFEYLRVYAAAAEQGVHKETAIVFITVIAIFAVFALGLVCMSSLQKPIRIMIFDVLAMGAFWIVQWVFKEERVIPNRHYNWGIARILVYVIGVVVFTGAVWLLIEKRNVKIENETEENIAKEG